MIRKYTLDNGLTVLAETMPHVRSVAIGVWLRRGSRDEPPRLNGISHFIEHLVFKGTEGRSARDIALAMDSIGGQMDAFTSKEYTCFYAKVLDEHLEEVVDLLADIVQRPLFDADEIERERQVVLEEIRMVEDTPDDVIYDLFASHFYPHHTLGRPIQGTLGTVSALTRRQLLAVFRDSYRPGNLLVAVAGNFKPARLERLLRRSFGSLARGPRGRRPRASPPRPSTTRVSRARKELEQLHLLLGLPAYPESYAGRFALYALNTILGGSMSSRLFQRIREERGLAYNVYSALNSFHDSGFMGIYAATGPDNGREVVRLVREELCDLRDRGPGEAELAVAKEHLKGSLMLSLESTSSRMSGLARQEIYFGRQRSLAETLQAIERVGVGEVHRIARRLAERATLSLVGVGRTDRLRLRDAELAL
jgi:predicted Zn-dependent peptidase